MTYFQPFPSRINNLNLLCKMWVCKIEYFFFSVRFDHEEEQLQKYVETFSSENGSCTKDSTNLYDLVDLVLNLKQNYKSLSKCQTNSGSQQTDFLACGNVNTTRQKRSVNIPLQIRDFLKNQRRTKTRTEPLDSLSGLTNQRPFNYHSKVRKRSTTNNEELQYRPKIFMFSMKTQSDNYFVVSSFEEVILATEADCNNSVVSQSYEEYLTNYAKIQKISHVVKYVGFSILSIMVLEVSLCFSFFFLFF